MAPPRPGRSRPRRLLISLAAVAALGALAAGCSGAPDRTEVADSTVAPSEAPSSAASATVPEEGVPAVPNPPDLSAADIDCSTVDGPCDHGDDPDLDRLWEACSDGDAGACDRLYYDSGFDTRYEQFGNTCGDRDEIVPCPRDLADG